MVRPATARAERVLFADGAEVKPQAGPFGELEPDPVAPFARQAAIESREPRSVPPVILEFDLQRLKVSIGTIAKDGAARFHRKPGDNIDLD